MADKGLFAREQLEKHSLDMRQFIDFRQSTLENGTRIIEAYNGSGLSYTLLPDRGLDIWTAHYNGLPLTWISQNSPFPPEFSAPWLSIFNGGLMVTCGLTHMSTIETDDVTGRFSDIHGNFTRLRASDLQVTRGWQGDRYVVELSGIIVEATLFAEQYRVTRTYRLTLGDPTVDVRDTIVNVADVAGPFMIMYHCNVGYPLIRDGARLLASPAGIVARDQNALIGLNRWDQYDGPTPRYPEQVFIHLANANADGQTEVAMVHGDFGLSLAWDARTLPYMTQWKNTRTGLYICGIEPVSCLPEGRNTARRKGRLPMLQPGETFTGALRLSVLDGADAVQAATGRIARLKDEGAPIAGASLRDYGVPTA